MTSILNTIKSNHGIEESDTSFDPDIIMAINSTLSELTSQLGVGPEEGLVITGPEEEWSLLYTDKRFAMVEEYIYQRSRLSFDPPASATIVKVITDNLTRLEFRIGIVVSLKLKEGGTR